VATHHVSSETVKVQVSVITQLQINKVLLWVV